MTKQHLTHPQKAKGQPNKKPANPLTNKGQYRKRKDLPDEKKAEYDKVKVALIAAWQEAGMNGQYHRAPLRKEFVAQFIRGHPRINGESLHPYEKLLTGVLKDQRGSMKALTEARPAKPLLKADAQALLEPFAKAAGREAWANDLPARYWQTAMEQEEDLRLL